LADWFKTVFMEDSENGGKGEMQERNRTVLYLPPEKVEREILSFWWSSTSKSGSREQVAIFEFFDRGRIVAFLIEHPEISCQSIFATIPSPHFPRATATLLQHGIALRHVLCI
jgi:hypothetical protein